MGKGVQIQNFDCEGRGWENKYIMGESDWEIQSRGQDIFLMQYQSKLQIFLGVNQYIFCERVGGGTWKKMVTRLWVNMQLEKTHSSPPLRYTNLMLAKYNVPPRPATNKMMGLMESDAY